MGERSVQDRDGGLTLWGERSVRDRDGGITPWRSAQFGTVMAG